MGLIGMNVSEIMKNIIYWAGPPWGSVAKWKIVNRDLTYLIHRHCDELKIAMKLARDLETRLVKDVKVCRTEMEDEFIRVVA
jgi:hypothetical protein